MKIRNLFRAFCVLAVATSFYSEAAVFDYNLTANLSDPGILVPDPQNNITTLTLPFVNSQGSAYGSGDTLNISIGFQGDQRLLLTANPTGQSAPSGQQGIGLFVYDSTLNSDVGGSLASSVSLVNPAGPYLVDSASVSQNFANGQGALTRLITDWTDTAFSVSGFNFQIQIGDITQPVLPNELVLEFREFDIQSVPEPATWCLLLTAAGIFSIVRRLRLAGTMR
jgi:hypothetical protein